MKSLIYNKPIHVLLFSCLLSCSHTIAQVRVVDNKGTISTIPIDWTRVLGTTKDIYNTDLGNVGIGTITPKATFHNAGSTILGANPASTVLSSSIALSSPDIDKYTLFNYAASASGVTLTLSSPADPISGRIITIANTGAANSFSVSGVVLPAGYAQSFVWNGIAWSAQSSPVALSVPFSGLTAAIADNTLDNTTFAQTWNWTTATTQNPLKMNAPALTTGSALSITGGSALTTGSLINATAAVGATTTKGLLNIANTAASSAGTVATIQANSTAGSGLTVLANGNVGVGTSAPAAALHLQAGTATAGTAPLKLSSGTNLTTAENGAVEFDGSHFYGTAGTNRLTLDNSSLTGTAGGTADAQTVTNSLSALSSGMTVTWVPSATNATTTPTLAVGTSAATTVKKSYNGALAALAAGDIVSTVAATAAYDGTNWILQNPQTGGSLPISSLTVANKINSIDNANFAQTWNWNTAAAENPLTLGASALTTGNLLTLTGGSALTTGSLINATAAVGATTTKGLLNIANTAASSAGTVAMIQANSTAGSGLTVLANGNVGLGTIAPKATLHNTGATIQGMTTAANAVATYAPTAATTVDLYSGAVLTQTAMTSAVTIPTPTDATAGRLFTLTNAAASAFPVTVGSYTIPAGFSGTFVWNGSAWSTPSAAASNVPFSGLTAAIADNTLDNTTYAQTWKWSTATTQNPLALSAAALTTGTLLGLSAPALTTGTGLSVSADKLTTGSAVSLSSASTAMNAAKVLNVTTSGANATGTMSTYAGYFANTHTGTAATNYGIYTEASGGTTNYALYAKGDVYVTGVVSAPSDMRLKKDIETLTNVLSKIEQMRGVRYEYKDQQKYVAGPQVGVIAQELQKVFPELVRTGADGFLSVNYSQLTAVLIQAVKEQQQEIDLLKKQMKQVMEKLNLN